MNKTSLPVIRVKMIIFGDTRVGKTALTVRFTQDCYSDYYNPAVASKCTN